MPWTGTLIHLIVEAGVDLKAILAQAERLSGQIVSWRRQIHEWPELGFDEVNTAALAQGVLASLGCRVRTGVGRTGVVAELGQGQPVVAPRADMDALPIEEATGEPFASKRPGLMHACGHDAHVAMLLGAASVLSRQHLRGTVRFLFQPSEESADAGNRTADSPSGEGLSGAARMIGDGAMRGVAAVFGLHVINELSTGEVGVRAGAAQAAADTLRLTRKIGLRIFLGVIGKGGHAAGPHLGRDSIYIAARLITAMQSVVAWT